MKQRLTGWVGVTGVVWLGGMASGCGSDIETTSPSEDAISSTDGAADGEVSGQGDALGDAVTSDVDAREDAAPGADAAVDSDAAVDADAALNEDAPEEADIEPDTVPGGDVSPTDPALGASCTADAECPTGSWCSTVPDQRRCSPRVLGGTENQLDFVFVPSGTFEQGTPGATNDERPYTATISRNYFVSRTEVTQGQWKALSVGVNPSCFQSTTGTSCTTSNANNSGPAEQVDWYSTLAYANALSASQGLSSCYLLSGCSDPTNGWQDGAHTGCTNATFTGLSCSGYRLLTESEWERAARAGTTSTYYWGEAADTTTVGVYAWFDANAGSRTQSVGGKTANAYGLFDMSGNVWEWVWDGVTHAPGWSGYPSNHATDHLGRPSGSSRAFRGGGWGFGNSYLRSAIRIFFAPDERPSYMGFRLARTAD